MTAEELPDAVDAVYEALFRSEMLRVLNLPCVGGRFTESRREELRRLARSAPLSEIPCNLYALDGEWEQTT